MKHIIAIILATLTQATKLEVLQDERGLGSSADEDVLDERAFDRLRILADDRIPDQGEEGVLSRGRGGLPAPLPGDFPASLPRRGEGLPAPEPEQDDIFTEEPQEERMRLLREKSLPSHNKSSNPEGKKSMSGFNLSDLGNLGDSTNVNIFNFFGPIYGDIHGHKDDDITEEKDADNKDLQEKPIDLPGPQIIEEIEDKSSVSPSPPPPPTIEISIPPRYEKEQPA